MTETSIIYCPQCGVNFNLSVGPDEEIYSECDCGIQPVEEFLEDIRDQLPMQADTDMVNKQDDSGSRGFQ